MRIDRKNEVNEKKMRLLNLLDVNNEDGLRDRLQAMTASEFILLNTEANALYETRKASASEFMDMVLSWMVTAMETDETLFRPMALIEAAEDMKASLLMQGYDGDTADIIASAEHMEFYRCVMDILEPGVSSKKSILIPKNFS